MRRNRFRILFNRKREKPELNNEFVGRKVFANIFEYHLSMSNEKLISMTLKKQKKLRILFDFESQTFEKTLC